MAEHPPDCPTPDFPDWRDDHSGGKGCGPKAGAAKHLRGKGFLAGYKLCRRSGLAPWCTVRLAVQYGCVLLLVIVLPLVAQAPSKTCTAKDGCIPIPICGQNQKCIERSEEAEAKIPIHVAMGMITIANDSGLGYCAAIMMPPDNSGYPAYVSWSSPPLGEFDEKAWRNLPTIFPDNMSAQKFVIAQCYGHHPGHNSL